jgi:type II secretory pathway pseudopilin PulG
MNAFLIGFVTVVIVILCFLAAGAFTSLQPEPNDEEDRV